MIGLERMNERKEDGYINSTAASYHGYYDGT